MRDRTEEVRDVLTGAVAPAQVFARRVREVRKAQELTQDEVGERLGRYQVFVKRTEAGQHVPTVGDLLGFAVALGVTPSQLLLPKDPDAVVQIAPKMALTARQLRPWVRGTQALRREDVPIFLAELPTDETAIE